MDMAIKTRFVDSWNRYFSGAELPISFYYTNADDAAERVPIPAAHMCMIGVLARVRKGTSLSFDVDLIGCGGGKRYTDFTQDISPNVRIFPVLRYSRQARRRAVQKVPRARQRDMEESFLITRSWEKVKKRIG
jgi:hypothetical protein